MANCDEVDSASCDRRVSIEKPSSTSPYSGSMDDSDLEMDSGPVSPPLFQNGSHEIISNLSAPLKTQPSLITKNVNNLDSPAYLNSSVGEKELVKSRSNVSHLNGSVPREAEVHLKQRVYASGSVEQDSIELTLDVVEIMSKKQLRMSSRRKPNRHLPAMIRTVKELSEKHEILFKGMMRKLEITRWNGASVFVKVVEEIFADELYNWGRVATVYAFLGWLARYCMQNDLEDCVQSITETAGLYVAKHLTSFITKSGGWVRILYICI